MTQTVLHIGIHKSGTTSLQAFVRDLKSIKHLEFLSDNENVRMRKIVDKIALSPFIDDELQEEASLLFKRILFVSSESLCGAREDLYKGAYLKYIPEMLNKVTGGNARILMTIRKPARVIASMYVDSVLYGHTLGFDEWFEVVRIRGWDTLWRVDRIYDSYAEYFETIEVVDFDELLSQPARRLYEITNSLDLMPEGLATKYASDLLESKNVSPTRLGVQIQRRVVNRYFETKLTKWMHVGSSKELGTYNFMRYIVNPWIKKRGWSMDATRFYEDYFKRQYPKLEDHYNKVYEDTKTRSEII